MKTNLNQLSIDELVDLVEKKVRKVGMQAAKSPDCTISIEKFYRFNVFFNQTLELFLWKYGMENSFNEQFKKNISVTVDGSNWFLDVGLDALDISVKSKKKYSVLHLFYVLNFVIAYQEEQIKNKEIEESERQLDEIKLRSLNTAYKKTKKKLLALTE